jgi:hypothetical protein
MMMGISDIRNANSTASNYTHLTMNTKKILRIASNNQLNLNNNTNNNNNNNNNGSNVKRLNNKKNQYQFNSAINLNRNSNNNNNNSFKSSNLRNFS